MNAGPQRTSLPRLPARPRHPVTGGRGGLLLLLLAHVPCHRHHRGSGCHHWHRWGDVGCLGRDGGWHHGGCGVRPHSWTQCPRTVAAANQSLGRHDDWRSERHRWAWFSSGWHCSGDHRQHLQLRRHRPAPGPSWAMQHASPYGSGVSHWAVGSKPVRGHPQAAAVPPRREPRG